MTSDIAAYRRVALPPARAFLVPILLFLLTLYTTTLVGARLGENFAANRPAFDIDRDLPAYWILITNPSRLTIGLPFSLTLLGILLVHELGHYIACLIYRVHATLPYFLPAPTFIGTLGAFIRIRSPIYSKKILFDIGVAGPIAGFLVLLPALAIGLAYSKVIPGIANRGDLLFGSPALLHFMEAIILPGVPAADIYLHPMARGAWVGVFATALNLLPIGQLDGGHMLYALFTRRWHKRLSQVFIAVLFVLGLLTRWYGWVFWAVLLLFFGMKHPVIFDETPLDPARRGTAMATFGIFALCFTITPVIPLLQS